MTRRIRLRAIRAALAESLELGLFDGQFYVCARGHEWLLWAFVGTLLHMADYMETWEPERKAHPRYLETANYVAEELERVHAEVVGVDLTLGAGRVHSARTARLC